jgi:thiamine monophosphate kinase
MKKTLVLGAFASLMMVSCAKDYSCKCVISDTTSGSNNSVTTTINGKKKDAKAACEAQNLVFGTVTQTCTIQ